MESIEIYPDDAFVATVEKDCGIGCGGSSGGGGEESSGCGKGSGCGGEESSGSGKGSGCGSKRCYGYGTAGRRDSGRSGRGYGFGNASGGGYAGADGSGGGKDYCSKCANRDIRFFGKLLDALDGDFDLWREEIDKLEGRVCPEVNKKDLTDF